MKELFSLIAKRNFRGIFYEKTDNVFIQFFRYCFVGGIATVVEGGSLWLIQYFMFHEGKGLHIFIAQTIAFILGLIANFFLSKLFVFQDKSERTNAAGEFLTYGIIGVAGLGIKWLMLWVFNKMLGWHYMLVWLAATVIVLIWNYAARKVILYRKK